MTPSTQEILYRVYGAWRLARFDVAGAQYFDSTRQAALRSFFCAVLVAPAFFIATLLSLHAQDATLKTETFLVLLAFALYYCLTWVAPPVIIHRVCLMIDREEAFFRYLSAGNWASMVTTHLQLVVALIGAGDFAPPGLIALLNLATYGYLLGYQWFLTRHSLDISPLAAVGIVALNTVIGLLISSIGLGIVVQSPG